MPTLIQVKAHAGSGVLRTTIHEWGDSMRTTGELLYLLMVIGGFTIFAATLAWVERSWRPKQNVSASPAQYARQPAE
jgi:hypothetical protein